MIEPALAFLVACGAILLLAFGVQAIVTGRDMERAKENEMGTQVGSLAWDGEHENYRIEQHVDGDNRSFVIVEINNNQHTRQALSPELAVRLARDLERAVDGLASVDAEEGDGDGRD